LRRRRPSPIAERLLDTDRQIALQATPKGVRRAFVALWKLDLAFADVVATSSLAELGAIRLAWWRERLEDLDQGAPTPAEPRLQAVATELLSRGITGGELSRLEDGWLPLLQSLPWDNAQAEALALRGRLLFGIGSHLLGRNPAEGEPFGAIWSLVDGVRHCTDRQSREFLIGRAKSAIADLPRRRISGELRPLTMIAAFAALDALNDGRGGWRRLLYSLRHSMFGIMPR
jgi:phytoene synthase